MAKILFLAANARNTVRLDLGREVRDVKDEIAKAGARDAFPVEAEFAVTPEQLQGFLQLHKPHVLHFSGHGLGQDEPGVLQRREVTRELLPGGDSPASADKPTGGTILFETKGGAAVAVRPEAFTRLLEIVQRIAPLRCVVLNACFSAKQADAVAQHVDCVIGMNRAVGDASAVAFAVGFYRAVAMGESVKTAFDLGCNEIEIRGLPDKDVPTPFHRPGVELEKLYLHPDKIVGNGKVPMRQMLRRGAPFVVALLCVLAGVAVFWAPGSGVPQRGTIMVAGPWLTSSVAREARRKLCEALEKVWQEDDPKIQCVARPLVGASDEALHKKALDAGSALLILIDVEGAARLRPLGWLANDELFDRALPRVERASSVAPALAEIAFSLVHIVQSSQDTTQLDLIRCAQVDQNTPRSVTLLALLMERSNPSCNQGVVDSPKLARSCKPGGADSDECKIARLVDMQLTNPSSNASQLRDFAIAGLQAAMAIRRARAACTNGNPDEAMPHFTELRDNKDPCIRFTASIPAACVLSEQKGEHPDRDAELRRVEAFADKKQELSYCRARLRASVLGERAFWRARRGSSAWDAAAADYEEAWNLHHVHGYRLPLIELLLSREQTVEDGRKKLKDVRDDTSLNVKARVHEALLSFIYELKVANRSGVELQKSRIVDAYQRVALEERVFQDENDKILKPLVCPDPAALCALTFLASPKTSASETLLKQALDASRVPPKPGAP